jgi:cytochrome c553
VKSYLWVLAAALLLIPAIGIAARRQEQPATPPPQGQVTTPPQPFHPPADLSWAFHKPSKNQPPADKPSTVEHVPGSSKAYTAAQIDDLHNPPDWFPNQHPPMPKVVASGDGPAVPACASCHLASGLGHPESADLAGLSATYLERQMGDFKSGARVDPARMSVIGKAMSDQDAKEASEYFASLKPQPWVTVKEVATVPKTYINNSFMRLPLPGGAMEPIGDQIVELPKNPSLAIKRDPNSGFIAYVPVGSLAKGKDLVTMGAAGKTIACNICHGAMLEGLGDVPRLAGAMPSYIARQLYYFRTGIRNGLSAALMKPVVQHLTDQDIQNIAAYLASLQPEASSGGTSATDSSDPVN